LTCIVTRRGDGGETSLLYGGRVPKDDLHTEAYGALDEAISALGLARATEPEGGGAGPGHGEGRGRDPSAVTRQSSCPADG
jgi:Cobalamin adenosyltransferase